MLMFLRLFLKNATNTKYFRLEILKRMPISSVSKKHYTAD
jgi:hypothetical protein